MGELTFEPPGPGAWTLMNDHFPEPVSMYCRDLYPPAQLDGFHQGAEHYGFLYDREIEFVNGFWYDRMAPIVGTPNAGDRRDAEFQERVNRLAETYEKKRWREDLEKWDTEWKPTHSETNRSLQTIAPTDLDDDDLVDHLENCHETLKDGVVLHHRMGICYNFPVYDFLNYASRWTSRPPHELRSLLDGASPDSAGPLDELQRLVRTIQDSPPTQRMVDSDEDPVAILEYLQKAGGEVEKAVNDWLDLVGYRLVSGWDLTQPYALERPATLVRTIRTALGDGTDGPADHDPSDHLAAIRKEVPAEHRDWFDELFEEARLVYRVRDERDLLDGPSRGLTRRAILEVGRRLTDRGRLSEPDHAVDLTHDELVAAFSGHDAPSADEVAARVRYRRTHDSADAPNHLGGPPIDPYAERNLPDPALRLLRGIQAYRQADAPESLPESPVDTPIRGLGASPGTAEGPARVVSGPADFSEIQEGDILVTEMTSPGYNVLLPLIEGIVTDTGGSLSHPAIVAREFGLPAVVGCENATDRIDDDDRIAIDGEEGTVQML